MDLGEFRLRDVNLRIKDREYFVILGPTGAGKSVLLETIAGFIRPQRGKILMDGMEVTRLPPHMRGVSVVYQDFQLFPHMSVEENIRYPLKFRSGRDVLEVAEEVGVKHLLRRRPETLSGGERQRVALARALVSEPKVLLLDEPTASLDPNFRNGIRDLLKELHSKHRFTAIHVTHSREEAVRMASRICVMEEGKVIQVGSPEEIFSRPRSLFVAEFVELKNVFPVEWKDGRATVGGVPIATPPGAKGRYLTIRPDEIIISKEPVKTSARNVLKGRVVGVADHHRVVEVSVDVRGTLFRVHLTRQSVEELGIQRGEVVYLIFKAASVNIF